MAPHAQTALTPFLCLAGSSLLVYNTPSHTDSSRLATKEGQCLAYKCPGFDWVKTGLC